MRSDYLDNGVINNPLNIKRVNGDLPNTKGSPKNIIVLIVVGALIALTANRVWGIAYAIIGNTSFTLFFLGLIYFVIIFTTMHFTVLEGPKNTKAYKDYLENKIKDLSVMWEIQDIKETEVSGVKVGYIDYIDSTRCLIIKCVPGAILNQESNRPLLHYNSIEKALNFLDELGFRWEIDSISEASDESEVLNYYYGQLKHYKDPEFVSIFTEILDTIDYLTDMKSSIENIYIKILAVGNRKHQMADKLFSVLNILRTNTSFKSVEFLSKDEIDILNASENSVNNYDREELIMNKYKSSENLGITAVVESYDKNGELARKFQNDFDPKKVVKKKSINLQQYRISTIEKGNKINLSRLRGFTDKRVGTVSLARPVTRAKTVTKVNSVALPKSTTRSLADEAAVARQQDGSPAEMPVTESQRVRDRKLLELIYSDNKVKLGE